MYSPASVPLGMSVEYFIPSNEYSNVPPVVSPAVINSCSSPVYVNPFAIGAITEGIACFISILKSEDILLFIIAFKLVVVPTFAVFSHLSFIIPLYNLVFSSHVKVISLLSKVTPSGKFLISTL